MVERAPNHIKSVRCRTDTEPAASAASRSRCTFVWSITESKAVMRPFCKAAAAFGATILASQAFVTPAFAQLVVYENDRFGGKSHQTNTELANFRRIGFNDRASSVVVMRYQWEVCDDVGFRGSCVVLRPGRYPSLSAMGLNDRVSSVRRIGSGVQVEDSRYAPPGLMVYDSHRRGGNEPVFQATVTSVYAVGGGPEQRCWTEHSRGSGKSNTTGAVVGAVLGGILGHQVGAGRGRDYATVAGVVAGAAIGSNAGRNRNSDRHYTQDVRRCTTERVGEPEYWDVSYRFRGIEHRAQMNYAPGRTISVNRRGEPRD